MQSFIFNKWCRQGGFYLILKGTESVQNLKKQDFMLRI